MIFPVNPSHRSECAQNTIFLNNGNISERKGLLQNEEILPKIRQIEIAGART